MNPSFQVAKAPPAPAPRGVDVCPCKKSIWHACPIRASSVLSFCARTSHNPDRCKILWLCCVLIVNRWSSSNPYPRKCEAKSSSAYDRVLDVFLFGFRIRCSQNGRREASKAFNFRSWFENTFPLIDMNKVTHSLVFDSDMVTDFRRYCSFEMAFFCQKLFWRATGGIQSIKRCSAIRRRIKRDQTRHNFDSTVYKPKMCPIYRWELWRAPVIQLLGGLSQRTAWGRGFCSRACHVDRVSALSSASIWWSWRSSGFPGCLRRDEPAQGGNPAGKSPRVEQ